MKRPQTLMFVEQICNLKLHIRNVDQNYSTDNVCDKYDVCIRKEGALGVWDDVNYFAFSAISRNYKVCAEFITPVLSFFAQSC